jgi:transposase-like protein
VAKRKRRRFTREFKAETVRLIEKTGKSIGEVARELDLTDSSVRAWLKQAEVDAGGGRDDELTTKEREELRHLRRENRRLKMEREILKKATAFFAKENQ